MLWKLGLFHFHCQGLYCMSGKEWMTESIQFEDRGWPFLVRPIAYLPHHPVSDSGMLLNDREVNTVTLLITLVPALLPRNIRQRTWFSLCFIQTRTMMCVCVCKERKGLPKFIQYTKIVFPNLFSTTVHFVSCGIKVELPNAL